MNYFKQKASPWVSIAVLAGGLVSAGILFWMTKIESSVQVLTSTVI